jgi:hypothetical protein
MFKTGLGRLLLAGRVVLALSVAVPSVVFAAPAVHVVRAQNLTLLPGKNANTAQVRFELSDSGAPQPKKIEFLLQIEAANERDPERLPVKLLDAVSISNKGVAPLFSKTVTIPYPYDQITAVSVIADPNNKIDNVSGVEAKTARHQYTRELELTNLTVKSQQFGSGVIEFTATNNSLLPVSQANWMVIVRKKAGALGGDEVITGNIAIAAKAGNGGVLGLANGKNGTLQKIITKAAYSDIVAVFATIDPEDKVYESDESDNELIWNKGQNEQVKKEEKQKNVDASQPQPGQPCAALVTERACLQNAACTWTDIPANPFVAKADRITGFCSPRVVVVEQSPMPTSGTNSTGEGTAAKQTTNSRTTAGDATPAGNATPSTGSGSGSATPNTSGGGSSTGSGSTTPTTSATSPSPSPVSSSSGSGSSGGSTSSSGSTSSNSTSGGGSASSGSATSGSSSGGDSSGSSASATN